MAGYYLFLDDERSPFTTIAKEKEYLETHPFGMGTQYPTKPWIIVRTYEEFIETIKTKGIPAVMSLDHDLGTEEEGIDCVKFIKEYCLDHEIRFVCLTFYHTGNIIGRENMKGMLNNLARATKNYM